MMRQTTRAMRGPGLFLAMMLLGPLPAAHGQAAPTRDEIIGQLERLEAPLEIDVHALKQQVLERARSRSRNEPPPQKRPPIAPDIMKLKGLNVDIQFDIDTPIVKPASYATLGRIADALVHSSLLPYSFVIVGHIEANGKREANAILSQRRADAIRDILVNTFKISAKRLHSIGLGEEQLLDPARPTGPLNQQLQILAIAKS